MYSTRQKKVPVSGPYNGRFMERAGPVRSRSVSVQISRSALFRSIRVPCIIFRTFVCSRKLLENVVWRSLVLDEYKKRRILEYNKQGYSPRRISDKNSRVSAIVGSPSFWLALALLDLPLDALVVDALRRLPPL